MGSDRDYEKIILGDLLEEKKYKGKYFINVNGDTYKFQFFIVKNTIR